MARVGGRNRIMAWVVGVLCAAVVVALLVLTVPLLPATAGWVGEMLRNATGTGRPVAEETEAAGDGAHTGPPTEWRTSTTRPCRRCWRPRPAR